jgi:Mg-chelatase subunit ChlD
MAPLLVLGVAFLAQACARDRRDAAADTTTPALAPEADRYRSTVSEGVGIALDIVLDNSGSMDDKVKGDARSKGEEARRAILAMLDATDRAIAANPDLPVKIALHTFSSKVDEVLPMQPYNRTLIRAALNSIPEPKGGTAIGYGLDAAREALYKSGMFRKNILVVTDGRNTTGPRPERIAREIFSRSGGEVHIYVVAFDTDPGRFAFVRGVRGTLVPAANAHGLQVALDTLYRGHVLAEAMPGSTAVPAVP